MVFESLNSFFFFPPKASGRDGVDERSGVGMVMISRLKKVIRWIPTIVNLVSNLQLSVLDEFLEVTPRG